MANITGPAVMTGVAERSGEAKGRKEGKKRREKGKKRYRSLFFLLTKKLSVYETSRWLPNNTLYQQS